MKNVTVSNLTMNPWTNLSSLHKKPLPFNFSNTQKLYGTMQELFLLQNQDKLFLSKQNEWVDGRDLNVIYKTEHKDEALNQLFETNTKDYGQRIHIISCPVNEKRLPQIDPDILPPPIPKAPKEHDDSNSPQLELAATDIDPSEQSTNDDQDAETELPFDAGLNIDRDNSGNSEEEITLEGTEEKT